MRTLLSASSAALVLGLCASASAAPAAPKGAHPRLFLGPTTLSAVKANAADSKSAVGRAIAQCKKVASNAADYQTSGYQGDNWAFPLSSCALAYQATGDASYAATGVTLWKALLSDVDKMGDGKACVAGASDTAAIAAIKRDDGYAIRMIGPHTALAYDWLHDAPGVDEALRAQSRTCFKAWLDWYGKSGYLNDTAGSNYHAGYVVAKSFISVAEGGEDGATSDKYWSEAVDDIFGKVIVGQGLATGGVLVGGDWAEGWQYGPLSVLEYSMSARALEEQGAMLPEMHQWSSDLTLRFVYGLLPARDFTYVGGDTEDNNPYITPSGRVLTATIGGLGSDQAAGWASWLKTNVTKDKDDAPAWDAIAEARSVTATDPNATPLPLWYLAKGTRNIYARSSWKPDAFYSVFASGHRLVPDHQHNEVGNFVFSRGSDHLIVDPSPYGSRTSLTSNAPAIDSNVVGADYRPSQTDFSTADLAFARGSKTGVTAARADYAKAFNFSEMPSDVPFALRDWVLLPEGEVVIIDRTRTDSDSRMTHLRFRSLPKLSLAGSVASGKQGSSQVVIHEVKVSGGTPSIKSYAATDSCDGATTGGCDVARFAIDQFTIDVPGPRALAIHTIDALGASEGMAVVTSMNDAPIDAAGQNAGVIGTAVRRGTSLSYVVATSANDAVVGSSMTYGTPGDNAARHVVFDAPADGSFKSNVTAAAQDGRCVVTITPGGSFTGRPLMFSVSTAGDGCKVAEDADAPPATVGPGDTAVPQGSADQGAASNGGCGCSFPRPRSAAATTVLALAGLAVSLTRKKRKN